MFMNIYKIFEKTYRPFILPIILLILVFFALIVPLAGGNLVLFVTSSWGLAILLMIFSVVYLEHLFTSPRDTIINAINAIIISIVFWETLRINFWASFLFSTIVLSFGILSLITYERNKKLSSLSKFVVSFGKARVIFPLIIVLSFLEISLGENNIGISMSNSILYLILFYGAGLRIWRYGSEESTS